MTTLLRWKISDVNLHLQIFHDGELCRVINKKKQHFKITFTSNNENDSYLIDNNKRTSVIHFCAPQSYVPHSLLLIRKYYMAISISIEIIIYTIDTIIKCEILFNFKVLYNSVVKKIINFLSKEKTPSELNFSLSKEFATWPKSWNSAKTHTF